MQNDERLSHLIGEIYDAALDPGLWVAVLPKCAQFVGAQGGGLLSRDAVSRSADAFYTFGVDPHFVQLYLDQYAKLDPTPATFFFFEIGQVVSTTDFMPYEEFCETRFFREWAQPQGWVDSMQAILEKSVATFAHLSFLRNESSGLVNDEARRLTQLIIPHIRRAVLIGRVIDLKAAEAATLADTLDGLAAGMFLVDADARIVHANAAGHAMLAAGDVLHAAGARLRARDPPADQALHDVFAAAGDGDAAVGIKGIAVPLTARDGERYVAHVLPLTAGARRRAGASYAAVAALFVHKAALDAPSPPEVIARTFKLTPTELRVLLAVVEVGGVPEVAEALGIAETTVRFHLRQLFAKTGTRRQADLVKLVAGFANPLVSGP